MGSIDQTLSVPVVTPSKVELNIKSSRKRFCEETGSPADLKIQCLVHAGSNPAKTTIAESFIPFTMGRPSGPPLQLQRCCSRLRHTMQPQG